MKSIFFSFIVLLAGSCNEDSGNIAASESQETIPQFQQIGTDEIIFNLKVLDLFEGEQDICGVQKSNVASIEVLEVIQKGNAVRQKVSKEEQFNLVFLFTPSNLEKQSLIEVRARETLCEDSSQTYFTVLAHKILD